MGETLGLTPPRLGHLPLLVEANAPSVRALHEKGYEPKVVVNYLARLSRVQSEQVLPLNELVQRFSVEAIISTPDRFDGSELSRIH